MRNLKKVLSITAAAAMAVSTKIIPVTPVSDFFIWQYPQVTPIKFSIAIKKTEC